MNLLRLVRSNMCRSQTNTQAMAIQRWAVTSMPPWERGIAAILLALLSPLLLLLVSWVKLISPGRALFVSERLGKDGHVFRLFKLRTMRQDAIAIMTHDMRTIVRDDDERLIPGGKLLRIGFDELFQLWNVVRGDTRFVGPRPDLAWMKDYYLPAALPKLSVAPGITGWAQVLGSRNLTTRQRYLLDLWYVAHRNAWLDVKIVLWTPLYMLTGIGPGAMLRDRCIAAMSNIGPLFIGDEAGERSK